MAPVWNPEARVTMGSDMPAETCYHIMELLSHPLGPEWEVSRQIIAHENRDNWSRASGLWGRPDLRPKVSAKQKRAITTRARPLDQPHLSNASILDVQNPAGTSASSAENEQVENSPETSTPTPEESSASRASPRTPEIAAAQEATPL